MMLSPLSTEIDADYRQGALRADAARRHRGADPARVVAGPRTDRVRGSRRGEEAALALFWVAVAMLLMV